LLHRQQRGSIEVHGTSVSESSSASPKVDGAEIREWRKAEAAARQYRILGNPFSALKAKLANAVCVHRNVCFVACRQVLDRAADLSEGHGQLEVVVWFRRTHCRWCWK
jgi:hypothetical protein